MSVGNLEQQQQQKKKKKSLRWLPHFWPERSEDEIAIDLSGGEEVQACEEEEFTSPHAKFEM